MSYAQNMYALSLDQAEALIKATGHHRTVLLQGHMGTGKSSLLTSLAADPDLSNHVPCYFDCTTKDLGDITLPNIKVNQDANKLNGRTSNNPAEIEQKEETGKQKEETTIYHLLDMLRWKISPTGQCLKRMLDLHSNGIGNRNHDLSHSNTSHH